MIKSERENQILDLIEKKGYVSVKETAELLFTSESSIRRDFTELEKAGFIKRSYGGAELIRARKNVLPFTTRADDFAEGKKKIARMAAELINDGDVVFIDSSSTGYFLAMEIMDRADITVVTNSIEIQALLSRGEAVVHSTGGILSRYNRICLVGRNAEKTFEEINADIAFFSSKSLSFDGIISDCTQEEVFVRRSMLKNAAKKVLLMNYEKIGTTSSFKQCNLSDIEILVCDRDVTEQFGKFCKVFKNMD